MRPVGAEDDRVRSGHLHSFRIVWIDRFDQFIAIGTFNIIPKSKQQTNFSFFDEYYSNFSVVLLEGFSIFELEISAGLIPDVGSAETVHRKVNGNRFAVFKAHDLKLTSRCNKYI